MSHPSHSRNLAATLGLLTSAPHPIILSLTGNETDRLREPTRLKLFRNIHQGEMQSPVSSFFARKLSESGGATHPASAVHESNVTAVVLPQHLIMHPPHEAGLPPHWPCALLEKGILPFIRVHTDQQKYATTDGTRQWLEILRMQGVCGITALSAVTVENYNEQRAFWEMQPLGAIASAAQAADLFPIVGTVVARTGFHSAAKHQQVTGSVCDAMQRMLQSSGVTMDRLGLTINLNSTGRDNEFQCSADRMATMTSEMINRVLKKSVRLVCVVDDDLAMDISDSATRRLQVHCRTNVSSLIEACRMPGYCGTLADILP